MDLGIGEELISSKKTTSILNEENFGRRTGRNASQIEKAWIRKHGGVLPTAIHPLLELTLELLTLSAEILNWPKELGSTRGTDVTETSKNGLKISSVLKKEEVKGLI